MKIESAIENGRSFKLRQTRQVDASESESLVHGKHATDHERSHTAHQWAVRRVRVEEGGEWVEKKKRNRRGTRAAGKHNHHHPPYHSPPIPPSSLAREGGL
jgi:hypothetical protein